MKRNEILKGYGESVFTTINRKAREHDAIDLGQGFPGYLPPEGLRDKLASVQDTVSNHQYAPSSGRGILKRSLSEFYRRIYGLDYDPRDEITVTSGATEAINSALMGLLNDGDEVLVFEPVYDQYVPVARRAGATVTVISLNPNDYGLPLRQLREATTTNTEVIVLNNPHNPTGTIFEPESLRKLVEVAERNDVILLSDEVYEHLYFDETDFVSLPEIEGARSRTIRFGSAGKTFDATGWKVGWAQGPPDLTESLRLAHQFTTYSTATPVQVALAEFFRDIDPEKFFEGFRENYAHRREILIEGLEPTPIQLLPNDGTYFIVGELEGNVTEHEGNIVEWLIEEAGVASIPLEAFYLESDPPGTRLRLAFCKSEEQLESAVGRLRRFFGS